MPIHSHRTTLFGNRQRYLVAVRRDGNVFLFFDCMRPEFDETEFDDCLEPLKLGGNDTSESVSEAQVEYSSSE